MVTNMNKYMIVFLVHLLAASVVFAQETCKEVSQDVNTPVPIALKDKEICIRDPKTGSMDCKSANEYKMVKRKQQFKVKERVVESPKAQTIVEVRETTVINKHIVSIVAHETVKDVKNYQSGNTAVGTVTTNYVPAITYQYQFDIGLVPLIGLDIKPKPQLMFGVGYEF